MANHRTSFFGPYFLLLNHQRINLISNHWKVFLCFFDGKWILKRPTREGLLQSPYVVCFTIFQYFPITVAYTQIIQIIKVIWCKIKSTHSIRGWAPPIHCPSIFFPTSATALATLGLTRESPWNRWSRHRVSGRSRLFLEDFVHLKSLILFSRDYIPIWGVPEMGVPSIIHL